MKLLLISIINSYKYGNTGVDYIANYLRENSKFIVDIKYYHKNESIDFIKKDLPLDYDFYGCSVFETNYFIFKKISVFIKNKNRRSLIFFGGQFVSMNYYEMIKDVPYVDYLILGDGEGPINRLLNHHLYKDEVLIGDCNIVSKEDFENKVKNIENHIYMKHDFDYFLQDDEYTNKQKTHCIMTKSNVCTGACSFCCSRKGKVLYKDIDLIVEEIYYLANSFGVRKIFFVDDDIFDIDNDENRNRLIELFQKIKNLNLNLLFSGFAKCKSICNNKNYDLLELMNDVGFHNLFLGIDAGNEKDRILYNKRATLEEGIKSINILNKIGISPRYGMIFINPYSTLETMKENYRYLTKLKSSNYYHYGGLKVQLLAGTKLLEKVKNDGLLGEEYSFVNTDAYNYKYSEIIPIVEFLDNELMPQLEVIKGQFNTLKRKYELVKNINCYYKMYEMNIKEWENKEYNALQEYFYYLYEENDIKYCRAKLSEFVSNMQKNSKIYMPVIKEFEKVYDETPIKRSDNFD